MLTILGEGGHGGWTREGGRGWIGSGAAVFLVTLMATQVAEGTGGLPVEGPEPLGGSKRLAHAEAPRKLQPGS